MSPLGRSHPCHSPKAAFISPEMVVATLGGDGDMQVFTLAFLPEHLAQRPVFAKDVAVQGG